MQLNLTESIGREFPHGPGSVDVVAEKLISLASERFGGRPSGRYRISRKFLRQLSGRRRLPPDYLADLAELLFERGYLFTDLETHFVVIEQRIVNGYRRVTSAAVQAVAAQDREHSETE